MAHEGLDPWSESMDTFPEIWTEILRRVPEEDRLLHVPLVSRRFSEACREPNLWPELRVRHSRLRTEARWRSLLCWLGPRVSGLQKLVFERNVARHSSRMVTNRQIRGILTAAEVWERHIPELLALLAASAHQLRSLEHCYPALCGFSSPASALPSALGQLSQLTSLRLHLGGAAVTTAQVDAMAQGLPSLERLALCAASDGALSDGFPLSVASSCSQLKELEILGAGEFGAVPPEVMQLTGLTRLVLESAGVTSLPPSISRLSALRELDLTANASELALPPELTACQQLSWLSIWPASDAAFPALARLQSLRYLRVMLPENEQPREPYWAQLTALTELDIDLDGSSSVPDALGHLSCLRKLSIGRADVDDLPTGPYLSRLESLEMQECTFNEGVPAALAAAAQLRHLDLECYNMGIDMSAADLAVLSALPALQSLQLRKPSEMSQAEWDAGLELLQDQCTAQGRAPPAIESGV